MILMFKDSTLFTKIYNAQKSHNLCKPSYCLQAWSSIRHGISETGVKLLFNMSMNLPKSSYLTILQIRLVGFNSNFFRFRIPPLHCNKARAAFASPRPATKELDCRQRPPPSWKTQRRRADKCTKIFISFHDFSIYGIYTPESTDSDSTMAHAMLGAQASLLKARGKSERDKALVKELFR